MVNNKKMNIAFVLYLVVTTTITFFVYKYFYNFR